MSKTKSAKAPASAMQADLEQQASRIGAVFAAAGFTPVNPPVLQPADIFLDRSGEEMRRRMYMFADPSGQELCLRPDLTIPTCRLFLEGKPDAKREARLSYRGLAFRFQTRRILPMREFTQIGVEYFGARDRVKADAEILALAVEAVRAAGLSRFRIEMGDLSLFGALVDALDIPEVWRARLKRHFWRPDYFRELLDRLVAPGGLQKEGPDRPGLFSALGALDEPQARAFIEEVIDLAGIQPVGGRTTAEIAERLLEQASDAGAEALPPQTARLIHQFLAISAPPDQAIAKIRALLKKSRISIEPALKALEQRFRRLEANGVDLAEARFSTGFGRNMEYYTGFVFELTVATPEGTLNVAGGGRYDTLLQSLGAPSPLPAVGCAIQAERLDYAIRLAKGGRS